MTFKSSGNIYTGIFRCITLYKYILNLQLKRRQILKKLKKKLYLILGEFKDNKFDGKG